MPIACLTEAIINYSKLKWL